MKDIYRILDDLKINYTKHEHPAVFTNDESGKLDIGLPEQNTKNLFLTDDKNQRFYLLTIQHGKRADIKKFGQLVGEKKLHFANQDWLQKLLGLTPGSVTPLGLVNDTGQQVKFYLDADLLSQKTIYIHPNINTTTLGISLEDLKKFVQFTGHQLNLYN